MIYALNGQGVPLPVRETIADAILANDANVLGAQVAAATIIDVRVDPDPLGLFCIYCLDTLSVIHADSWFSDTATQMTVWAAISTWAY